jgi:hypothetical protein
MSMRRLFLFFALIFGSSALAKIDPEWTTAVPPFQITDRIYYVGSQELAAYLVTTRAGNILINANLETSPPQIRGSVKKLGFGGRIRRSCSIARRTSIICQAPRRSCGRPVRRTW